MFITKPLETTTKPLYKQVRDINNAENKIELKRLLAEYIKLNYSFLLCSSDEDVNEKMIMRMVNDNYKFLKQRAKECYKDPFQEDELDKKIKAETELKQMEEQKQQMNISELPKIIE